MTTWPPLLHHDVQDEVGRSRSFPAGAIAAQTAPSKANLWLDVNASAFTVSTVAGDRAIILAADQTWEGPAVQEPNVWFDEAAGLWKMLYTGSFSSEALGYATALSPAGPWTKYAGNPVLGNGGGGYAPLVAHAAVFIEGTNGYVYFPDAANGGNLKVATFDTSDPTQMTVQSATVLSTTGTALGHVNSSVVKDGTTYRMIFESHVSTSDWWNLGYATATSPLGPFTISTFPLSTLSYGGAYGGPQLSLRDDGTWVLLYHAATSSTLPLDTYRATSTNLTTWTKESGPLVAHGVLTQEADSACDPMYENDGAGGHLFWSAMNNTTPSGAIVYSRVRPTNTPQWHNGAGFVAVLPTLYDEGSALPVRPSINFVGSGVTASDDSPNKRTTVTVSGSGASVTKSKATRTAGNVTVTSTSFIAVDTAIDLSVAAAAGDVIIVGISTAASNNTANALMAFDVATLVSGSVVNWLSGGASEGITGMRVQTPNANQWCPTPGTIMYTVQSGDVSGGSVTLRLFARTNTGSMFVMGSSTNPLIWWVLK